MTKEPATEDASRERFERCLRHASEQAQKGHWLNAAATLNEANTIALRELKRHLSEPSSTG